MILLWDITFSKSTKKAEPALWLDGGFNFKNPRKKNNLNLHLLCFPPHQSNAEIIIHFTRKSGAVLKFVKHTFLLLSENALVQQVAFTILQEEKQQNQIDYICCPTHGGVGIFELCMSDFFPFSFF